MNKKQVGRPVDLSGINIQEIYDWITSNKLSRKVLICQSMIALHNGAKMTEVCNVFDVTRESVRKWKNQFRNDGLKGVLKEKKVGKRSKLNVEKKKELKSIIRKSPGKQGYNNDKWTGLLIQDYVRESWKLNISLRTAQIWLSKIK